MANVSQREPSRNAVQGPPRVSPSDDTPRTGDLLDSDLREEMRRLAEENASLLQALQAEAPAEAAERALDPLSDLQVFAEENGRLREQLAEQLRANEAWAERQREWEA